MTSFSRSRSFRRGLTVIYWIALPLALLAMAGSVMPGNQYQGWLPSGAYAVAFGLFAAIIGWRLWLNSRSLGHVAPSVRRLTLVLVPLCLLAIAGLIIALLGASWVGIGVWFTVHPHMTAPPAYWALVTAALGLLTMLLGAALAFPFIRTVRRRPSAPTGEAAPAPESDS